MEDSFDFGMKKMKPEGELEVTGVSRSGRVRKKSSKLTDFENLDEIDMRIPKSKKDKQDYIVTAPRSMKKEKIILKEEAFSDEEEMNPGNIAVKSEPLFLKEENISDMEFEGYGNESSLDSLGSELEDLDEVEEPEEPDGFQPIVASDDAPSQNQSLYLMEKSNKKKLVIKDGKVVGRMKARRKDKGKARFTAYMLWAKEIRSELTKHNPDLDFSQTSKKLGELWSSVPFHEKYIWKRRAQRLAAKASSGGGGGGAQMKNSAPGGGGLISSGQLHQLTGASPAAVSGSGSAGHQSHHQDGGATGGGAATGGGGGGGGVGKRIKSPPVRKYINKQSVTPPTLNPSALSSPETPRSNRSSSVSGDSGVFKPAGTSPLDVAAHLRLLGENLTNIGERLIEKEGQQVSGSLSVLLDSLLCSLVPLVCLTQQVPHLNVISQEQLSHMMDNIAYIMPGMA